MSNDEQRSLVLYPAVSIVSVDFAGRQDRLLLLLALEIAVTGRPTPD
jgi:hypothetical protein